MRMVKVTDFGFKNLETINFFRTPKCDCKQCDNDKSLVVPDFNELGGVVRGLLADIKTFRAAGLVLRNNNKHRIYTPYNVIHGGEFDGRYECLEMNPEEYGEDYFIDLFADIVDDYNVSDVVILQELEEEDNLYRAIYRNW